MIGGGLGFGADELSTPSLGITRESGGRAAGGPQDRFQLPLSGSLWESPGIKGKSVAFNSLSRDHRRSWTKQPDRASALFQLPLSGSLPSRRGGGDGEGSDAFNSLSRDHEAQRRASIRLALNKEFLSTPSLGITEPDSGIFRLSAAFCRGTSSHK